MAVGWRRVGWASPRWWLAASAVLAALLSAPSLTHGFFLDDHVQRYAVKGHPGVMHGLDLFTFGKGDPEQIRPYIERGPYPWWTDPTFRISLFRPLSSALMHLDEAAFGDAAWLHHLHSLLWSVLFVLAGGLVLRRLVPAGPVFALALLFFTFDDARWLPATWIANRNALVAGSFALLALELHLRWRQDGVRWAAPLSALCLGLGLLGGEGALGVVGFFAAHALLVERRWRSLLPLACVLGPYVVLYKALGYGARGSGVYIDPGQSPLDYLVAAPGRLLALIGSLELNLPADLWVAVPSLVPALVVGGALTAGLIGWLFWRTREGLAAEERGGFDTLVLGSLVALLPTLATFPASRLLMVPGLGAAGALALAARHLLRTEHRVLLGALLFIHLPFSAGQWLLNQVVFGRMGVSANATVAATEVELDRADLRVVVLTSGDPPTFVYVPLQRVLLGAPLPARWWILSHTQHPHRFTRTSERAFELETVDGAFLDTIFEQLTRTPQKPFAVGDRVQLDGASIEVLAVEGWAPKRIRFTLDGPLEAEDVRVLWWHDGALRRFPLPPVGAVVELPHEPGVMAKGLQP